MKTAYPDAEIYCLDLIENVSKTSETIDKYDMRIHAMAEYFEVNLVEHRAESGIKVSNYHAYTVDTTCLHPNTNGFYQMTKTVMKTMLKSKDN